MIAVSGATGFLGAHVVCHLLKQGSTVRAFRRVRSSLDEFNYIFSIYFPSNTLPGTHPNLFWADADVTDPASLEDALDGAETVVHCAAQVSFDPKDLKNMHAVNAEGTANMVNMSLLKGVKLFCHVSSIAALGRENPVMEANEKSKWVTSPYNSGYSVTKHKAEMEVWRGIEEGLNAVIVNPGVILGIGNWKKGSCHLFELPWKSFPFYTEGENGYVDVRDVARAITELMARTDCYGERWVLVGENTSIRHFMHTVAGYYQKKKAGIRVNKLIAEIAWRLYAVYGFLTGKAPSITRESARASLNHYRYSSKKITERTGFVFTPLEETLSYISKQFIKDHTS